MGDPSYSSSPHCQHCRPRRLFHVKHSEPAERPLFHVKQRAFSRPAESVTQTLQSLQWPMNPRSRSLATTPIARSTTDQPRITTWTRKGIHQRGSSTNEGCPPSKRQQCSTTARRLMTRIRRSVHQQNALTYEERPSSRSLYQRKRPTIEDTYQQGPLTSKPTPPLNPLAISGGQPLGYSPADPINCGQRTAPGTLPASRPGPGRARRGGGRTPRRGRRIQ